MSLVNIMLASKLIYYFSSRSAVFGLQASILLDNIILNVACKNTDQVLSNFQADIGTAALATLEMEQLTSHMGLTITDYT